MFQSNKNILVIDEPFLDLDYCEKKKITSLINKLVRNGKTVIIGSDDINIIYSLCKKVLLLNDSEIDYQSISCLTKEEVLNKYKEEMPNIVRFIKLANKRNVNISYSKDIRDLIKDVYRNVSKK